MKKEHQKLIARTIINLILERGEILTTGAFESGGRPKAFVANAKARAESDPKGLLKELGISGSVSGTDLEKVQKILNSSIHSNSLMSRAYMGTRVTKDKPKGQKTEQDVVAIKLGEIDRKNGIRFLAHTLRAATNSRYLELEKSVQFSSGENNELIIYTVEQSD